MALYTKRTTVFAKIETTPGTDSTPTAAANAIMAFDVSLDIKADMKQRHPGNADRSAYSEIRGKTSVELKFWVELKGSGTAGTATRYAPLLQACDRLEVDGASCVYSPVVATSQTVTIWVNIDGVLHKMAGCAGDCEIELVSGEIGKLQFTFSGIYVLATDSALETMTYDSTIPVIVKGTTTSFAGALAIIEKINLKFGNKVTERPHLGATEGIQSFIIGDRYATGSITCEAVLRASSNADYLSYFDAGTTKALSFQLGATDGNIVIIKAPVCVLGAPKWGDRDGIRTFEIPFQMARSAGNDEITIETR